MIRAATDADWVRVWPLWREIVTAGDTYAYPLEATSDQARALWLEPAPGLTVVDAADDTILGTAKMGANRPGRGSHIGTASFMVDPAARGQGVGRRLAEYVVDWHRREGYAGIQFNAVVETNTPAVRLWQSLGFQIIGTVPAAFDSATHGRVGLHVMFLAL